MDPSLEKLTPDRMQRSAWSGGTTTQICIFPREARYADRDFLWRISSATVDLPESDFTPLPDYERFISTLRGGIVLSHGQRVPVTLEPFAVHGFSGGDATHCVGTCTDFNLVLRRGKAEGSMESISLTREARELLLDNRTDETVVYCAEGCCRIRSGSNEAELTAGEAVILTNASDLLASAERAVLMLCQMRQCR